MHKIEGKARTSCDYGFQMWPSPSTYLNKYLFSDGTSTHQENICAKLFLSLYTKKEAMAWQAQFMTIWHSNVTMTFNLLDQICQKAILLIKENSFAKLFEIHAYL